MEEKEEKISEMYLPPFQELKLKKGIEDVMYMPKNMRVTHLVQQSKILIIYHMPMLPLMDNKNGHDEIHREGSLSMAQAIQYPHTV